MPDKDGMVECKYRMKRKMFPVGEVELIDLHPDYRLSETTRRIPFVNYTDSVRISMGTSIFNSRLFLGKENYIELLELSEILELAGDELIKSLQRLCDITKILFLR